MALIYPKPNRQHKPVLGVKVYVYQFGEHRFYELSQDEYVFLLSCVRNPRLRDQMKQLAFGVMYGQSRTATILMPEQLLPDLRETNFSA